MSKIALGMTPYRFYTSSETAVLESSTPLVIVSTTISGPSIVNVFPDPLCPYMKMVPLNPSRSYFTVASDVLRYASF